MPLGQSAGFAVQATQDPLRQSGMVGVAHCALLQHVWQLPEQQTLPPPQVERSGSTVQVPTEPLTLHAWQVASQAELQQTPSGQKPEVHCPPWVQDSPFGRSPTHWRSPLQKEPATQSVSVLQLVAQALPAHWV